MKSNKIATPKKSQIKHCNLIKIIYKNIKDLKPAKNNPRKITDEAINVVKNSILEFGMKNPILIDKHHETIAGHTRLKALQLIQMENESAIDFTKIPCVVADDLTKQEVIALRIADNKTSEFSLWDEDLLKAECNQLEDVDMSLFGLMLNDVDMINEKREQEEIEKIQHKKMIVCPNCGCEIEDK